MAAATSPASAAVASAVTRQGRQLYLNGAPYRFTGVDAYELATNWSVNYGCGGQASDAQLDSFFASLRPATMVRIWAFQRQAYNKFTRQIDFSPIDRVMNAAQSHGQKVILTLANQWADCDGGQQKDVGWYAGGYRQVPTNPEGSTPLSYWDYLHQIVPRYANSPAVGMWEPVNEPETPGNGTCASGGAATLRQFFDDVGGEIHRLDANHLVESGTGGYGPCGTQSSEYEYVHQSTGIDVASYHDYGADDAPMPGDQWNGLQVRLNQMAAINKPLIVGEVGMMAQGSPATCMSLSDRSAKMRTKMDTQFGAGIAGFVPWNWVPAANASCSYELSAGDPLLALLHDYPLSTGGATRRPRRGI